MSQLSISSPSTTIRAANWIPIGAFVVETGRQAVISGATVLISAMASDSSDPCAGVGKNEINTDTSSASLAYLAILRDFDSSTAPFLQQYSEILLAPADFNTADTASAPIFSSKVTAATTIVDPGVYHVILVNNTTNRKLQCSATVSADIIEV
jgi:hypothetical protein